MLRLLGFFALTFVVYQVLIRIPVVGSLAGTIPLIGFILAAVIVSRVLAKWGSYAMDRRREKALMRQLGAVDTPHNQGKLGQLLLKQGRYRDAVPLLEAARDAEPDSADLNYRLGCALLGAGSFDEATRALERAVELDEEHAYGSAMMRLAEARQRQGDAEGALEALDRFERNHGPGPECAYRRGVALKSLGRSDEAKRALAEVGSLSSEAVGYQKREAAAWSLRAMFARLL